MKTGSDEVMSAVAGGLVSGEVATRAIEERNKLRMLDEEEAEAKAGLGRYDEMGEREQLAFFGCLRICLSRGYEARRELIRRRLESRGGAESAEEDTTE